MKAFQPINLIAASFLILSTSCDQKQKRESGSNNSGQAGNQAATEWKHPLTKMGRLNSPLVEVQPFMINGEFYVLENWRSSWDWPGQPHREAGMNNEMWIAHLPDGPENYEKRQYLSMALKGNTLGTAIAEEGIVYVFGVNEASDRKFVEMTWSEDLKDWSDPVKVLDSPAGKIFNVSLWKDDRGYVFLWETDGVGKPFTMCFGRLENLTDTWNEHIIEGAVYGREKYTGGPEVVFTNGWYYLLYLEDLESGWETRVARSKDLVTWEDASEDRPFLPFSEDHKNLPLHPPEVQEINASDPGLTEYNGQVIVYFTGGIQQRGGDLQWARYEGAVEGLLSSFFE